VADFDLGGTISDIFSNLTKGVVTYFGQAQQLKQAKKMAKLAASGGGGFPTLGTGNMNFAGGSQMFPSYTPAVYGPQQQDAGMISIGGPYGLNIGDSTPAVRTPRGPAIFQGADGRMYRSIGRPILWSGDLAAFKRVRKVAHKLRSYAGHSRFR
jgi:hypothetical protein